MIRGVDVATPNIAGSTNPYEVDATVGINQTKKRTNMVGQNAIAKLAPKRNELIFPSFRLIGIWFVKLCINFNFKIPSSTSPVKISRGPMAFRNKGKYSVISDSNDCPKNHASKPISWHGAAAPINPSKIAVIIGE